MFLYASFSFSQNLHGTVRDKSNTPMPGANVYFDNSSLATITDADGNFYFDLNTKLNLTLVISYIGYKKQYLKDFDFNLSLNIILEEEQTTIKEVIIEEQFFSRKEKLALFREQFLGDTKAAKKAVIENEDDIYFSYDKQTNTLSAFSDVPLKINNPYLGYVIFYELASFKVGFSKRSIKSSDTKTIFYSGYSRFEETISDENMLKRREKYYQGSTLHFFRSLSKEELTKNNFIIYKGGLARNPASCFAVKDTLGMKEVTVRKINIESKDTETFYNILYNERERSRITFPNFTFYIDYLGNYSSLENMFLLGEFGRKRIADMLPLNYGIQ